jgi:hypothetical protein
MTGTKRTLSYAAPALAVLFVLAFAGRAEAAASCGHYVTYKGMPAAHDMPGHSADHEHQSPSERCPCRGPNCSRAPMNVPPIAPSTVLTLEKEPVHYSLSEIVLERGSAAELFGSELLVTQYSPADIFRPPCCA